MSICTKTHHIRPRHRQAAKNEYCVHEDPDCPHPQDVKDIEFKKQSMVDWLNPVQLAMTGVKTVIAAKFGGYADKREMEAALSAAATGVDRDYSEHEELWFDYVADLGDGFDATYTVACALAAEKLTLTDDTTLPRGRFLILGGDQVYPTASRDEYQNRFLGPYRAALPWTRDNAELYALPGNHDWYDGLTSFIRIFCQSTGEGGRWIGGWRTRQRRSYFALRLPHNWWIWGIDSQLESDLDRPQLEYFSRIAQTMCEGGAPQKQKIILVTAEPNWVFSGGEKAAEACCPVEGDAFRTLFWFENRYIRRNEFQLRLVVAGDLHHYVRYESAKTQRITAGGGGAYLMATHHMPEELTLPEGTTETFEAEVPPVAYTRQKCYPDVDQSKTMAAGVLALPVRNRWFTALLMGAYVLLGLTMLTDVLPTVLLAATIVALFFQHTYEHQKYQPKLHWIAGLLHGVVQVTLALAATYAGYSFGSEWGRVGGVIAAIAAAAASGFLGSLVFAAFMLHMSRTTGAHTEEVFSSMAIPDFKNFLRMHVARDGTLTIHAIGIDEVVKDWKFEKVPREECGRRWYVSKKPIAAKRIEDPIVLR